MNSCWRGMPHVAEPQRHPKTGGSGAFMDLRWVDAGGARCGGDEWHLLDVLHITRRVDVHVWNTHIVDGHLRGWDLGDRLSLVLLSSSDCRGAGSDGGCSWFLP